MKRKSKLNIRLIAGITIGALIVGMSPVSAMASDLYRYDESQTIAKDTTYEVSHIMTEDGPQYVYTLTVPLNDDYINVKPIVSTKEPQLKETTSSLVNENGAIAGVNGDFFNMTGTYSAPVGPVVVDGQVLTVDQLENSGGNQYSSFILDDDNNPFVGYVNFNIQWLTNGKENLDVNYWNDTGNLDYATYIDQNLAKNTADIDAKYNTNKKLTADNYTSKGLVKFVVKNGVVTYVSTPGEVVNVPADGYVITCNADAASYYKSLIHVGDTASVDVTANVDVDSIKEAIGGGGMLIQNGQVVDSGLIPSGRQPRTALGVSQDETQLILMVVDGRGDSIGATASELASLMQNAGAYNAMIFDGGGSSTMAVETPGEEAASVVNTPSEGTQRKVANGIGVFDDSPTGDLSQILVLPQNDVTFKDTALPVNVVGSDDYYNEVPIDKTQVTVTSSDPNATYTDGKFVPSTTGDIDITATMADGMTDTATINAKQIAQLKPLNKSISTTVGGKTALGFNGTSTDGYSSYVYGGLNYTVSPSTLGHMEGDTFVADNKGTGYIKCSLDGVDCYIDVAVDTTGTVSHPKDTAYGDPLWVNLSEAPKSGTTDITFGGDMSMAKDEKPADYAKTQNTAISALNKNSSEVYFAGANGDINDTVVPNNKYNSGYKVLNQGNAVVVQMTAADGGLQATDPSQWSKFYNDIMNSGKNNAIIELDVAPSNFDNSNETELFKEALTQIAGTGKNVYVISTQGTGTTINVENGVRYINLGNLFNADGTPNKDFRVLRFNQNGDSMTYDLEKVFS